MHHVVTFLGRDTPWCWNDESHQLQLCSKGSDGMKLQLANETIKINSLFGESYALLYFALHCMALHCTALLSTALHCLVLHCIAFTLHCLEKRKRRANDAFRKMKSNRAIMQQSIRNHSRRPRSENASVVSCTYSYRINKSAQWVSKREKPKDTASLS